MFCFIFCFPDAQKYTNGQYLVISQHPHGGGEGKSPIGRPSPVTPWGKPAMGYKTRKKNHRTDKQIARRRNGK